ncbi:hypothetical protein ACETU7_28010 [Rhodococcus sp. 3Y1]
MATQLAILSYCTPLLALGPIIPGRLRRPDPTIFLAAMYCFFTTMVGTLAGLRSADKTSLDLVAAYGGGRSQVPQSSTCERTSEHLCCPQDCCTFGRTGCNSR